MKDQNVSKDIQPLSKPCTNCHKEKLLTDFRDHTKRGKKYKRPECYDCHLLMNRLAGYCHNRERVTVLEFRQMYENQQGLCKCCGIPIMLEKCDIDHNHATGKIRSLVCRRCNIMIGHIENGEYMTAVEYLDTFR